MDGTALQFSGVQRQFSEVGARIDDLRRGNAEVAGMIRELSQIALRQMDEVALHRRELGEHREQIRQIFARMEQGDARIEQQNARIEEMSREIRRILDAIERRGGDGGGRQP
jgi:methyl-accepting chemotaxis protein